MILDAEQHDLDLHWLEENREIMRDTLQRSIPPRFRDARPTTPEVQRWVDEMIVGSAERYKGSSQPPRLAPDGPSLLLLGPTGTGKTYEAYGALRAICESGVRARVVFSTAADLYAALRPTAISSPSNRFEYYANAEVLFLDDIGAAKNSEWIEEINYRLINYRYEQMLRTFVTGNLLPRDLAGYIGDRVHSRLMQMSTTVIVKGEDRRLRK